MIENITGEVIRTTMIVNQKNVEENWTSIFNLLKKYEVRPNEDWTLNGILNKDIISIYRLLVELSRTFPFSYQLPCNLSVSLVVKQVKSTMTLEY